MNVGRGLFRSWVFLSTVWVTAVGVGAYMYVPKKLAENWGYVAEMIPSIGWADQSLSPISLCR
jgi:hypothetical protein